MNNENEISRQTKLYGYIGEHAGVSRFSAVMNKSFKASAHDAMMIPMNIREDDLYFTLTNLRKSQLSAVVISAEYTQSAIEIVDEASGLAKRSGMCDIIFIKNEKLHGDIFSLRALSEHLKDLYASKIAIIGISPYAKAFSFLACGFELSFYHDDLEALMEFTKEVELQNADINRIAKGMSLDFSSYDAVLDFSDMSAFEMIEKLTKHNLDMKNNKQFSPLKQRATELDATYTSSDAIIEKLCAAALNEIKK